MKSLAHPDRVGEFPRPRWLILSMLAVSLLMTACPTEGPPPDGQNDPPPANQPPEFADQAFDIEFNQATRLALVASDPDNGPAALAFVIDAPPAHGTLAALDTALEYLPHAEYVGDDSFVAHVSDGECDSRAARIALRVLAPPLPTLATLREPAAPSFRQPTALTLRWAAAIGATSYDVYFGASNPPPLVGNTSEEIWPVSALSPGTWHYWRIGTRNAAGAVEGEVWSFQTAPLAGPMHAWGFANIGGCAGASLPADNDRFVKVACGSQFNVGLRADGTLAAWADFLDSDLQPPATNDAFVAIAAGEYHGLALRANGSLMAWGRNWHGQIAIPEPSVNFVAIAAGGEHNLALRADGSIVAWGDRSELPTPNSGFVAIAAGVHHDLALRADGSIVAWGSNESGQLDVPLPNSGYTAISAGAAYSMALRSDGSVVVWGDNTFHQHDVPADNSGFVAISAGWSRCMALRADSSLAGWGGRMGAPWEPQVQMPPENYGFIDVSAGTCQYVGVRVLGWRPSPSDPMPTP